MKQLSYKVEFKEVQKYVFDVQAENEQEAITKGGELFSIAEDNGTLHYNEYGDKEADLSEATVYDVTGTDDDTFLLGND
jgi:hypothetical protein